MSSYGWSPHHLLHNIEKQKQNYDIFSIQKFIYPKMIFLVMHIIMYIFFNILISCFFQNYF
jgi:hypothetical protein